MHTEGEEVHVSETEASAGSKEGVVRWVLIIGTVLAIVFLSIIWMTGALTQGDIEEEANVSAKIADQKDGEATDSIVGGSLDDIEAAAPETEMEDGVSVIENDTDGQ